MPENRHGARSGAGLAVAMLTLASLLWAGNLIIGRAMRADMPPVAMAFWRWTVALFVILPFAWRDLLRQRAIILRSWKVFLVLGVSGIGLYNTMVYTGLQTTTATNATLFNSLIPALIAPIAWLVLRERMRPMQIVGVVVSILGVAVIVAQGHLTNLLHLGINVGDLWILISLLLWAFYTVALRFRPPDVRAVPFLAATILFGMPALSLLYAMEVATGARFDVTATTLTAIAYWGTMPSVVAYLLFNRGVERFGASRGGIFIHLVPVFGVVLSTIFLNEVPHAYHAAGIALVMVGIWFTTAARFSRH